MAPPYAKKDNAGETRFTGGANQCDENYSAAVTENSDGTNAIRNAMEIKRFLANYNLEDIFQKINQATETSGMETTSKLECIAKATVNETTNTTPVNEYTENRNSAVPATGDVTKAIHNAMRIKTFLAKYNLQEIIQTISEVGDSQIKHPMELENQ